MNTYPKAMVDKEFYRCFYNSRCWNLVASQEALRYYLIEWRIISVIFSRKLTQLFCFNVKHDGWFPLWLCVPSRLIIQQRSFFFFFVPFMLGDFLTRVSWFTYFMLPDFSNAQDAKEACVLFLFWGLSVCCSLHWESCFQADVGILSYVPVICIGTYILMMMWFPPLVLLLFPYILSGFKDHRTTFSGLIILRPVCRWFAWMDDIHLCLDPCIVSCVSAALKADGLVCST